MTFRTYRYVGPADVFRLVEPGSGGYAVRSSTDFAEWASATAPAELSEPFTYTIGMDGLLRLAPRRSEHVACAGRRRVSAAGEISFERRADGWNVGEVSNQSTGYCPDLASWSAVAAALDAIGIEHSGGFTYEVVFRRCPECHEPSIVRDDDYVCVFCGGGLPTTWNIDDSDGAA